MMMILSAIAMVLAVVVGYGIGMADPGALAVGVPGLALSLWAFHRVNRMS